MVATAGYKAWLATVSNRRAVRQFRSPTATRQGPVSQLRAGLRIGCPCAPAETRGGGVRACHNPTMRGNDPLPPSLTGAFRSASFCASAAWTLATSPVRSPISSRTESPAGGFRRRAPSGIGPYARLSVTAGFQPKVSESGTPMEACDWTNLQWPFSRTRTQVIRAGRSPPSARVKRPCPSAQATSPWM